MRRGDLITVAVQGDYGKPRLAIVVQADRAATESVLVCLLTTEIVDAPLMRLSVEPSPTNGLLKPSQIMVEKIFAVRRERCGTVIGRLGAEALVALDQMLLVIMGLAGR